MDEYKKMKRQLINDLIVTIIEARLKDHKSSDWSDEDIVCDALDFTELVIEDMEERDIYNG